MKQIVFEDITKKIESKNEDSFDCSTALELLNAVLFINITT